MVYDLKTPRVPRLAGWQLRFAVRLAESSLTGSILHGQMLKNIGFESFRETISLDEIAMGPLLPRTLTLSEVKASLDSFSEPTSQSDNSDFRFETCAEFREAYVSGACTPLDVAQRVLKNAQKSTAHQPAMAIFIAQESDDLLKQAEASTKRYQDGQPLGPLDGIPVPVKDELDQTPYPTTGGTRFLQDKRPVTEDATVVARLRAQGALLIGKVNMHELGIGVTGMNAHYGAARNPYDPACFTGGSSSGSAAAVAGGFGPIAIGADGGGSIRIPAALCGVVGLKPTFGRVSEHGAVPLCWSVAHVGPLAASVADCALGFSMMAGEDPHDLNTKHRPPVNLQNWQNDDLNGTRIGIFTPWFEDAEEEIVTACKIGIQNLQDAGATIVEIPVAHLDLLRLSHLTTIGIEMATSQIPYEREHSKDYGLDTRLNLALARGLSPTDYVHAQRHRQFLCHQFAKIYEEVDVIATPSTGCVSKPIPADALPHGESNLELLSHIMRFAAPANLLGLPAISCPIGYAQTKMPMGIQFMGRPFDEGRLLQLAHVIERNTVKQAPLWYEPLLQSSAPS